jgi:hypothetical protein
MEMGVIRLGLSWAAMKRVLLVASLVAILWTFTACGIRDDETGTAAPSTNASTAVTSTALRSDGLAGILLFNGTGSSPNDVKAFEAILKEQHVNYLKVNSRN